MQPHEHMPRMQAVRGVLLSASIATEGGTELTELHLGIDGRRVEAIAFGHDVKWLDRFCAPLSEETYDLLKVSNLARPIATRTRPCADSALLRHIPTCQCPVAGVVAGTRDLVGAIEAEPLRAFVESVFARRDVHDRYWTLPASMAHHHSFEGGLAAHSLEVAADIATQSTLTGTERDLGIAAALLHDIGKVWSYDGKQMTRAAWAMGHELLGLARLEPAISTLERAWEDGALAMRVLLSGQARRRADGSYPYALVQRLRACDQRSAERARHIGGSRAGRAWSPAGFDSIDSALQA